MLESSIKGQLLASSSFVADIGSNLFIGHIPSSAGYPCVGIFQVSNSEAPNYDTPRTRIQFTCFGNTYLQAKGISESIKTQLKRFYGTMSTAFPLFIVHSVVENDVYLYDDSILKHCMVLDMFFKYVK
jgi:hypothetical protein